MMMRWVFAALVLMWSPLSEGGRPEATRLAAEARSLERAGHLELAIERYHEALGEDPDDLSIVEALIPLWMKTERFDAAVAHLETATLRHPRFAAGWYALAYAYRRLGRSRMAILAYEAYIDLRPQSADPYYGIAMVHLEAGNRAEARAALVRYLRLERRPERQSFVGRARSELAELGGAPPREPIRRDRAVVEAQALARAGRWDDVSEQLHGYRALDVQNRAIAQALRAEAEAARGRSGAALLPALLSAVMAPLSPEPWRALVRTLLPSYLYTESH